MSEEEIEEIHWMNKSGVTSLLEPETYGIMDMDEWIIFVVDEYDADTNDRKSERKLFHAHRENGKRWISLKTEAGTIDAPHNCPNCSAKPDNFETFYDLWSLGQDQ